LLNLYYFKVWWTGKTTISNSENEQILFEGYDKNPDLVFFSPLFGARTSVNYKFRSPQPRHQNERAKTKIVSKQTV